MVVFMDWKSDCGVTRLKTDLLPALQQVESFKLKPYRKGFCMMKPHLQSHLVFFLVLLHFEEERTVGPVVKRVCVFSMESEHV